MKELNDKQFEQVLDVVHKYVGTVQFAYDEETVTQVRKDFKKDLEVLLDNFTKL